MHDAAHESTMTAEVTQVSRASTRASTPASTPASTSASTGEQSVSHAVQTRVHGKHLLILPVILLPPIATVAAMWLAWGGWFGWTELALFASFYLATGLGITVGFHRLFTHRSFQATPALTWALGICGSMALEGPVIWWVATHRCHHQHSDDELDPHSPHAGRRPGIVGWVRAFAHAHCGWFFTDKIVSMRRYAPDLMADRRVMRIYRLFPLWVLAGFAVPAIIGGLVSMSWTGALLGFLWGGLVRVFLVHHVTWSVNSVCHIWGRRDYEVGDESRNNAIVGFLALGEGWHNNHHAFPTSARHGLEWWQLDLSWIVIRLFEMVGLAKQVRTVPNLRRESRRANASAGEQD